MPESNMFGEAFIKQQYLVMKKIAKTIFSPVGLLDLASRTVFAYDLDTITLDPAGTIIFRITLLTCEHLNL